MLLDTHVLLWFMSSARELGSGARASIGSAPTVYASAASLWEIAIKNTLGRDDFRVAPRVLRRGLLDNGYAELPITSEHAVNIDSLPRMHKDPFDRMLLSQALTEGITLLTSDAQVARYGGSVRKV